MNNYLEAGITALANTKLKVDHPWFFAHFGAAVLAGHFILQREDLSAHIKTKVALVLNDIMQSQTEFFTPIEQDSEASDVPIDELLDALQKCATTHSTTGHGVIYGALALKGIIQNPSLLTASVSKALIRLLDDCLIDMPHRYLGIPDYYSNSVDFSKMRTFTSVKAAADYSLTLHKTVYPDQTINGTYHFLAGDLLHCVTYSQALLELEQLGFIDIAKSGLDCLARHMHLSAREHSELEVIKPPKALSPEELVFWDRPLTEPHQIKLAYSAMEIASKHSADYKKQVYKDLSKYWSSSGEAQTPDA